MRGVRYAAPGVLRGWKEAAGSGGDGTLLLLDLAGDPELDDERGGSAELGIGSDGSVRLRACLSESPAIRVEEAAQRGTWRAVRATTRARGGGRLSFGGPEARVLVEIEASPLAIRVLDRHRKAICQLRELRFAPDGAARIELVVAPDERFFGFGEQPGPPDKRGRRLVVDPSPPWQPAGGGTAVPFCLVHRSDPGGPGCYGLLVDAFSGTCFDLGAADPERLGIETEGGLDLMIFPGPTPAEVLRRFTRRVGRTPLPPIWALGHHLTRADAEGERELRGLARELLTRGVPADALHVATSAADGLEPHGWDARRFPDPAGLLHSLTSQGLRLVARAGPGVRVDPGAPAFASGSAHDVFCRRGDGALFTYRAAAGERALPDFNREPVRHWWGRRHESLVESGVEGICNEPDETRGPLARFAGRDREPELLQAEPADPDRRVPFRALRGIAGHQIARATREALETLGCERRPFVLTGSAWTGTQRYAAVRTAPRRSDWEGLRSSVVALLGLGTAGLPFCGFEIGGSAGSCPPELYARWVQIGALAPLARTDCGGAAPRREPWRFASDIQAIARAALQLRMRLLPYLYALFRHSETSGAPIWRTLAHEFPHDPQAADSDDQLMIGPALLAAPVLAAGLREREVYLPEGVWIDWHDGARYAGARRLRVAAPLDRMPLFARGGSLLPTRSPVRNSLEPPAEPLVLEVFPGADASLELLEDDGETLAYRGDVVSRTALRLWTRAGGRLRLELGRREGPYAVGERPLRVCVHACPTPSAVLLDGAPLTPAGDGAGADAPRPSWEHDAQGRLQVRLRDAGAGLALEVDPAP